MSEEKELFKAGTDTSGFKFKLSDKSFIDFKSGEINLQDAEMKYFDEEGNEISKEQFNELRLKRLEEKMDRILELLEGKELSNTIFLDGKEIGAIIKDSNYGCKSKNRVNQL